MKKLTQIFLLAAILLTSHYAQAGTRKRIKPTDPAPQDTSSVRAKFKGPTTNVGGEVILTITVLDVNNHPVNGALVSAPCTGSAAKYTNTQGVVQFSMGTSCSCSNDEVTVTTTKGCYQRLKVNCGSYSVVCNQ